jgi:5-methylthioadenosine/S-adenosylhomocysteine deaminase
VSRAPVAGFTTVIRNATVVTVDAADRVIENGSVRIEHGVITEVGLSVNHGGTVNDGGPVNEEADEVIDAQGGIVLPGLVNTHAHLTMTLLRGVADGTNLDQFLATVLPIEGAVLSPDFVRTGTELAAAECLRAGNTSVLDMYFFPEAALEAAATVGLRLHTGPVFIQFPGADNRPWDARMQWAHEWFLRPPVSAGSARWACPHSTYLLTEPQLRELAAAVNDSGTRVTVHAAETQAEVAQVAELHGGRTPVQVLADVGLLHDRVVLAHAVHLTATDIALIAAAGAHVAHNPASNAKLASGLAPIRELIDAGVNVTLGTDGPSSGNDLDLWMAIRLAGYLPSIMRSDPTLISARELIRMATINGAKALGVDSTLGSIEVGKRADIVMLDGLAPATQPSFDAYGTLAYATSRAEVDTVLVGGVAMVRGGRVLNMPADLRARVAAAAADVNKVRSRG